MRQVERAERPRTQQQALEELAAIFQGSDDAIASRTLDGIVTSWNPAATRIFGYEPAEIIGKPIAMIIPPELDEEQTEILARLRRGECLDHFETELVAKDGLRIDVSLTVAPMRDERGSIVGALQIARDLTERKQADNMLRDANRRNDEFLSTLAHELRNPLAPICAAAELLRNAEDLPPEPRAAVNILERQVRQLTQLLDNLLDVARIASGRTRLPPIANVSLDERVPSEGPTRAVSRRVLVADDNHDAAVSLSMLLQALGHETRIAHDGLEALKEAEVFRPEVVLLDIAMPKLDGYGAAREIASRPWAGSTRFVAVTGWDQEADRQLTREAGFHQHLVKPADPDILQQIILGQK